MKKILLITVLAMMLTAANSFATPIIDFSTGLGSFGGLVTKTGATTYVGNNIRIGSVTVSGAPTGNGTYAVSGLAGGFGALSFDTSTGVISVVGSIAGLGVGPTTLLSGTITSFTPTLILGGDLYITAAGPDSKAVSLLAAIGLPANQAFNFYGFNIANRKLALNTLGQQQWEAYSTDIINVAPEPTSIVLLGSGLLGLAGLARKRLF